MAEFWPQMDTDEHRLDSGFCWDECSSVSGGQCPPYGYKNEYRMQNGKCKMWNVVVRS